MKYNKEEALKLVVSCAEKYKAELEGRNLLFICMDKHQTVSCFEFAFFDYNFLHLTGLNTAIRAKGDSGGQDIVGILSAVRFYEKCLDHKLTVNDFEFSDSGTTPMKLDVLPLVICKNLSANMVGNFNSTHPRLYTEKVAGGTKAYMGFVKDNISDQYVPNTVIKEDIRNHVSDYVRVIATYRKQMSDDKYIECVYTAKKVKWNKIKLPDELSYLKSSE